MKNDILYLHSIEAFLHKLPINYKQWSKPADIILKSKLTSLVMGNVM